MVEQVRAKKCERYRPIDRVRSAMKRLSRDRWIPGCEVEEKAWKLCKLAAPGNPFSVERTAVPRECYFIGMFNGEPPAYTDEPFYRRVFSNLFGVKSSKGLKVELYLLGIELERKQHEQRNH